MVSPIRILLADNQSLTSAGVHHLLAEKPEYTIVGEVTNAEDFNEYVAHQSPDLVIVDYNLPNFINVSHLEQIIQILPHTKLLILSSDNNKSSILQVLSLGVLGYITKECGKEEILMAIQSTSKGEKFFCHKILNIIMENRFQPEPTNNSILTSRETEILTLIAQGHSNVVIADRLHISPHTIHSHRKSIIRKLNIKSPTEFVIYALDFGLIKPK
jgi:two-component system invasion response regulator UvrY